jgi:Transposase DDE domain
LSAKLLLQADSISGLREAFGPMIPDALLCLQKHGSGSRQRLFSPLLTFWAFLSQVLSPHSACREAVRKVQAWWALRHQRDISPDPSAYCQARARLPDQTLLRVHEQLADRLERNVASQSRWRGRNVTLVDGTNLSMPDTAQNQGAYPQPSTQKPGCGFPMMKLVGLFSLASGALLHFARGSLHIHESQLFGQLWKHLAKGDVILGDRGFCSFFAIGSLLQLGVDSVMRLHPTRRVDCRRGKRLAKDDFLLQWKKPRRRTAAWSQEAFAALPEVLNLRHIRLKVSVKGYRTRSLILVTTLLDPEAYPGRSHRRTLLPALERGTALSGD